MNDLNKLVLNAGDYLRRDIWRIRIEEAPRLQAAGIRLLRTAVLSVQGFARDNCLLRASSLTFYSLLSIVPVVAMAFGVAKGFGFEKKLQSQLLEQIPGQEEVLLQVVDSAHRFLENTKGGLIAGIGIIVLFWSVIKVLGHIENSFNVIWKIRKSRAFGRKFADYLSIMLIGPVLVIMSSSTTVYITTQITEITRDVEFLGLFSELIFSMLKLLPYGLIWILFTIIYMLMPNTKVRFVSAFLAGVVAGTTYQIVQWAYISFQVGVARYNAIYGSFAALPLFLIWLQISWLVVLFGAEISQAVQNNRQHASGKNTGEVSPYVLQMTSLLTVHLIIKAFVAGKPALTAESVARALAMPDQMIRSVLDRLVEGRILSRVESPDDDDPGFLPAVDTGLLTVQRVTESIQHYGKEEIAIPGGPVLDALTDSLEAFRKTIQHSPANRLLKEIG